MKRLVYAVVAVLLATLPWGAAPVSADSITVLGILRAVETSTGTRNVATNTREGATFVGTLAGTAPGQVTLAVNYTPVDPVCGGTNTITEGTFTLVTARGTLTGRVTSGTVQFDPTCAVGTVTGNLVVTGGTGQFAGAQGSGSFTGLLNHLPLRFSRPATLTGAVDLTVSRP